MICSRCAANFDTPVTKELESLSEVTSTRIDALLACNVAPFGRERDSLSDLMSRTQDYAISLDTRITELRAALEHLLDEKSATEQRLRDLKLVLHPIRIVPPEILGKIFEDAVFGAFNVPLLLKQIREGVFADSIGSSSPNCIVSQVSSTWRRTALQAQTLWRFVHVCFDRYPRNLSTSNFLNRFLARSAEQILNVVLHATVDHPAMTVVLMSSKRWQTAAISFPPPIYRSWNVPNLSFPSLWKLHLHIHLDGIHTVQDLWAGNGTFRLDTPQLQRFSSDTAAAVSAVIQPTYLRLIHFEQAGTLDEKLDDGHYGVSCMGPSVMIASLSLPLLTSAVFHVPKMVPESFYNIISLSIPLPNAYPNMRALRLVGTSAGYQSFLSRFPLPRLKTLSLEDSEPGGHSSFPSPLIAPTGQCLTLLKVSLQNADDTNSLVAFLRTTPKLRRLELRTRTHFDVGHTIRAVLVDEEGLLPDLTKLVITSQDPDGVGISGAFVDAIEQRCNAKSQMVEVREVCLTSNHMLWLAFRPLK